MKMIVPDDLRGVIRSFPISNDLILDVWKFLDEDIPSHYQQFRGNRPSDFADEGFLVHHTWWTGKISHTFSMWVDDASATGFLFLRDIQYDPIDHSEFESNRSG